MTASIQEHVASVSRLIFTKIRDDTSSVKADGSGIWNKALKTASLIWKGLFVFAAEEVYQSQADATPLMFMGACETVLSGLRALLSGMWSSTNDQGGI